MHPPGPIGSPLRIHEYDRHWIPLARLNQGEHFKGFIHGTETARKQHRGIRFLQKGHFSIKKVFIIDISRAAFKNGIAFLFKGKPDVHPKGMLLPCPFIGGMHDPGPPARNDHIPALCKSAPQFFGHLIDGLLGLGSGGAEDGHFLYLTIGCKGLLGYLKALGGSNIVKVVPSNGGASGSQTNGHKGLKVICGSNTSYIADGDWIGEKTPMTLCEVRVSPKSTVNPNVGASELAEALNRVLPFTAKDDNRPVLQCVYFVAKDGNLTLVSADGFRLAVTRLDYDDGEGQALINRDDLKGVANALKTPIVRL